MALGYGEIILRLLLATAIGIIFGVERKRSKKPVGARTHVLIALAACVIAIISAYGFVDASQYYAAGIVVNTDPARLVVGILTGIGFIGAGIIFRTPTGVQGITTAAEIFFLATLGIACGLGCYFIAGIATVIAIINMLAVDILIFFRKRRKADKEENTESAAETEEKIDDSPETSL